MNNKIINHDAKAFKVLHKNFVGTAKQFGRGVFIVDIELDEDYIVKGKVVVGFITISEINNSISIENKSVEDAMKSDYILSTIEKYDVIYQYFILFNINNIIVGGAFIPFNDATELGIAFDNAVFSYKENPGAY